MFQNMTGKYALAGSLMRTVTVEWRMETHGVLVANVLQWEEEMEQAHKANARGRC